MSLWVLDVVVDDFLVKKNRKEKFNFGGSGPVIYK